LEEIKLCNDFLNYHACREEGIPPWSSQEVIAISAVSFQISKRDAADVLPQGSHVMAVISIGYEKTFITHYSQS